MGYKGGYAEQRRARELARLGSSSGLRGSDIVKYVPHLVSLPRPTVQNLPAGAMSQFSAGRHAAWGFKHPTVAPASAAIENWRETWLSTARPPKGMPRIARIVEKNKRPFERDIEKFLGGVDQPQNFTRKVFELGYKSAGPDIPNIVPAEHYKRLQHENDLMRKKAEGWQSMMTSSSRTFDANLGRFQGIRDSVMSLGRPTTGKERKNFLIENNVWAERYKDGSRHTGAVSERMHYETFIARVYNAGFLAAAQHKVGQKFVLVRDGAGCGWEEHNDPYKADGITVTIEEAAAHPLAHPHCVREFFLVPPEDKDAEARAQESLKQLKAARKAARALTNTQKALRTAEAVSTVASILGISSIDISGVMWTGKVSGSTYFEGTIGDWVVNKVIDRAMIAMQELQAMQQRLISILSINSEMRAMSVRLKEAAMELRKTYQMSQLDAENFIASELSAAQGVWEKTGSNVTSIATKKVLIPVDAAREQVVRVVGQDWETWNRYSRLRAFASVSEGGIDTLAKLMEDQNVLTQWMWDRVAPYGGKRFRLSLPKMNVREGGSGARATHRYAKATFSPVDFVRLHTSVRPERGGSLRTVQNIRLNPNGLLRFGFVKDERGIITPNFSVVPKGPLRIYSRINRVPTTSAKTINGVTTMVENKLTAGRVNSITTEVKLLVRQTDFVDGISAKFRVDLRRLGIYKPSDIKDISYHKLRFMMADEDWFKYVNTTVNLRLRGYNFFDIQKSLSFDDRRLFLIKHGLRNIDNNIRLLVDFYASMMEQVQGGLTRTGLETKAFKEGKAALQSAKDRLDLRGIGIARKTTAAEEAQGIAARLGPSTLAEVQQAGINLQTQGQLSSLKAFLDVQAGVIRQFNDADLFKIQKNIDAARYGLLTKRVDAARAAGVTNEEISHVIGDVPESFGWMQLTRYTFDLSQLKIHSNVEQVIDYLIMQRRAGIRPDVRLGTTYKTIDKADTRYFKEVLAESPAQISDDLILERPRLVMALLEADPVKVAKDLGMKVLDLEQRKLQIWLRAQEILDQHIPLVSDEFRIGVLTRLNAMELKHPWLIPELGPDRFYYEANGARMRWMHPAPGWLKNGESPFVPGEIYKAKDFGTPFIHETIHDALLTVKGERSIVEYLVDGESIQTQIGLKLYLRGSYQVTGYSRIERGGLLTMPRDVPDTVNVMHRVYLRQLETKVDYGALAKALDDTGTMDLLSHFRRHELFREAYPDVTDAATRYLAGAASTPDIRLLAKVADDGLSEGILDVPRRPLHQFHSMTAAEIEAMKPGTRIRQTHGLWDESMVGAFPESSNVTFLATGIRGFNITPLGEFQEENLWQLFSNGEFEVLRTLGILQPDGTTHWTISMKWKRPVRIS